MNNSEKILTPSPSGVPCISAIHRANRQAMLFIDELIRDLRVSSSEAHLISFLHLFGPSSVGELVRVFGYRKPTMSSMINKLEQKGYLRRELSASDRRSLLIHLTARGHELAEPCLQRVQGLDAAIREQVTAGDLEGFEKVLLAVSHITGIEVRKRKIGE
jgi:DNA-binding MarR family transcriptional regulator